MTTTPTDRPAGTVDPKLLEILVCPLTKGPLEYDAATAGTDLALRQARVSDPRRHPNHAARGSPPAGLSRLPVSSSRRWMIRTRGFEPHNNLAIQMPTRAGMTVLGKENMLKIWGRNTSSTCRR